MGDDEHASPIEFRHDSMLRIESPHDTSNATRKKPRIHNPISTKLSSNRREEPSGCSVLRTGSVSGIEFSVLCLTKPIVLSGCAWVSVLHQGVRIFGHTIHPNQKPILVVSAPFAPLLIKLSPSRSSTEDKKAVKTVETERNLSPAALVHNQIRISLGPDFEVPASTATVVIISSCPRTEQHWKEADGLPEADDLPWSLSETLQNLSLPQFDSFEPVVPSLRISQSTDNIPTFEEWADWDSFLRQIDTFLADRPSSELRILVSGAGGSGKSTFVRCLSNYLVTVCGRLVFIDTDVGQPELNLPGLVAAHEVCDLHVGSALAHIRGVPLTARLLGETTPRDDPDLYEAGIAAVSESGLAHATRFGLPVVINTDGWVSGAGSEFLNSVVAQTRPTHAVCMFVGKPQATGSRPSFRVNNLELQVSYIQRPLNETRPLYTRSVARELQICAYFCKELCLGRVRAVAMADLPLIIRGERVDNIDRALLLMNGSIVAMATSNVHSISKLSEANVVGFGLVRGVSLESKMAYISSAVAPKMLKKSVALLLCEHIHVPSAMMLGAASASQEGCSSPFILRDHIESSRHMHSRSSLQRRTTNAAEGLTF